MEMKGDIAQGRDVRTRRLSYKYPTLVQVRLGIKGIKEVQIGHLICINKRCYVLFQNEGEIIKGGSHESISR